MVNQALNYRPDIDGLRAVAVLSVLLFHAGIGEASGGYVGVDVFFVISGYLITLILAKEIGNDGFSIASFYERRFRRLLPALFFVVLTTFVFGLSLLHPRDLLDLGQSVLATSVFSSNILFNLESGYFDGPAEYKPLLHTWSLGVEEQFYIFFPILLLIFHKYFKQNIRVWIPIIFCLSFAYCVVWTKINATSAFYLLPSRAWELLAGSLIAIQIFPRLTSKIVRELLSIIGMSLIIGSIFSFTKETIFPGYAALIPVLGAALILYTGEHSAEKTLVAKMLSNRILVFVGLISYSLYLWHWPVIVFSNYVAHDELSVTTTAIMLIGIFAISIFSWKYVETPFRKKRWVAGSSSLLKGAFVASAIMAVLGISAVVGNGLPQRYAYASSNFIDDSKQWKKWGACQNSMKSRLSKGGELCEIGSKANTPTFILWGDSHARSLAPAVELSADNWNKTGVIATRGACPPFLGIERPGRISCGNFNDQVIEYIASSDNIETVLLAGRWTLHDTGERYKDELGDNVSLRDLESGNVGDSNSQLVTIGLDRTINRLTELGKSVILINQIPEVGFDVPSNDFLSKIFDFDLEARISPKPEEYNARNANVIVLLDELERKYELDLIQPFDYLCSGDVCSVSSNGQALYLDDNHLSITGSRNLSLMFDSVFRSPQ